MWWLDTPASSLADLASRVTAAGRITGLLGTYLVPIEVVLMGRIPWLDRLIGMDRLAAWHRRNGEYAIWLLVATPGGAPASTHTGLHDRPEESEGPTWRRLPGPASTFFAPPTA
jgi:hypothetical protein